MDKLPKKIEKIANATYSICAFTLLVATSISIWVTLMALAAAIAWRACELAYSVVAHG